MCLSFNSEWHITTNQLEDLLIMQRVICCKVYIWHLWTTWQLWMCCVKIPAKISGNLPIVMATKVATYVATLNLNTVCIYTNYINFAKVQWNTWVHAIWPLVHSYIWACMEGLHVNVTMAGSSTWTGYIYILHNPCMVDRTIYIALCSARLSKYSNAIITRKCLGMRL